MLASIMTIALLLLLAIIVTIWRDREERRELKSASTADREKMEIKS
jgi:hypothetical protein